MILERFDIVGVFDFKHGKDATETEPHSGWQWGVSMEEIREEERMRKYGSSRAQGDMEKTIDTHLSALSTALDGGIERSCTIRRTLMT